MLRNNNQLSNTNMEEVFKMAVVTISRQFGIGGSKITRQLGSSLGWRFYGNDLADKIAEKMELSNEDILNYQKQLAFTSKWEASAFGGRLAFFETNSMDEKKYRKILVETVNEFADRNNIIFLGWGCQCILKERPNTFHFRLVADMDLRLKIIRSYYRNPEDIPTNKMLEHILNHKDKQRRQYIRKHFKANVENPGLYHSVFNLSKLGIERVVDLMLKIVRNEPSMMYRPQAVA